MSVPVLQGDALRAVQHRGSHVQILAGAGTGKTEVMRQRIVALLSEGVPPEGIVALTFNIDAAEELKRRVAEAVEAHAGLGPLFLHRLSRCFVGTIHSYCFQLLQTYVARYETYEVLDDHRLAAFLARIERQIRLKDLRGSLYASMETFKANLEVVDNEMIPPVRLKEPFRSVYKDFLAALEQFRLITYGQQIAAAVRELDRPEVFEAVHRPLRHVLVDEYQDVNLAQERLISRLAQEPVELCVVGDDDQSIYQWRGTDVGNIVEFSRRYRNVKTFKITTNRRSRPTIIRAANAFAKTIQGRLAKEMRPHRPAASEEVVLWTAPTEADEARRIAETIEALVRDGYNYRDIAVLFRGWVSLPALADALESRGIPIMPGGRTGLFRQPEPDLFGRTFAFLAGTDWSSEPYGQRQAVRLKDLVTEYGAQFQLSAAARERVERRLRKWKGSVEQKDNPVDLISDYYALLRECGLHNWDLRADPVLAARAGTIGRCSLILKDYESVRRRAKPDAKNPGQQLGGTDRGKWYYFGLATFIQNWAHGAYEAFEGDDRFVTNAVELSTVHQAKGLEWPVVFVCGLSRSRFPSSRTGRPRQDWFVPSHLFDHTRYEGTENDERRLFYVAMTRARDWLSLSTHEAVKKGRVGSSPFLLDVAAAIQAGLPSLPQLALPAPNGGTSQPEELLTITYSELASYASCGYAYRLRTGLGFEAPIAPELGYGKSVHHILRQVAEQARQRGHPPTARQVERLFGEDFYLPAASKPAHQRMKAAAADLVRDFVDSHGNSLIRVWAIERPFELHVRNGIVSGRADVILREHDDGRVLYEINDYKVSESPDLTPHDRQLRVYTSAGRKEGLDVAGANVFDLRSRAKRNVDVSPSTVQGTEKEVASLIDRLKDKDFSPVPGAQCMRCDVQAICRFKAKRKGA